MLEFSIIAFSTFAAILNPLGILPQFIVFTDGCSKHEIKRISLTAAKVAGVSIVVLSLVGNYLFKFFGITLPAFRFAGGVILFLIALDMLRANPMRTKSTEEEHSESMDKENIAIFPVAVPLICGPGTITTALIIGEKAKNVYEHLIIIGIVLFMMILTYLSLISSRKISEFMGSIGRNVLIRFMGILLAAVASQFIFDSLFELGKKFKELI